MKKSGLVALIIGLVVVAAAAVALTSQTKKPQTAPNNTSQNPTSQNAGNQLSGSINIMNTMFMPPQITVAKGGTVTWTNNDSTAHTITNDLSGTGGPASAEVPPGGTYKFTFNKTGSFQYHCSIHTSMRGTIVVKG